VLSIVLGFGTYIKLFLEVLWGFCLRKYVNRDHLISHIDVMIWYQSADTARTCELREFYGLSFSRFKNFPSLVAGSKSFAYRTVIRGSGAVA